MRANLQSGGWWHGVIGPVGGTDGQVHTAQEELKEQVNAAYREWQAAESCFQEVSDPNQVDGAIYAMDAAQRKYLDLFRQLRQGSGEAVHQEG